MMGIIPGSERGGQGARRGLTLFEMVVLVFVVLLLGWFGMTQVRGARREVREELAAQHVRDIAKACALYRQAHDDYPANLRTLGPPESDPPYLPLSLAQESASVQGYRFAYTRPQPQAFMLRADPVQHGVSGVRHFVADQTIAVHATTENRDAVMTDPAS